jgi:hypothetical protein
MQPTIQFERITKNGKIQEPCRANNMPMALEGQSVDHVASHSHAR